MRWVLENLLRLALTLMVSTSAALLLRPLLEANGGWAYPARGEHVVASNQSRARSAAPLADRPLVITYQPRPARTAEAIRQGVTGVVKLEVLLAANGTVGAVQLREKLPAGLTERAIEAAEEIEFRPAVVGGQFVDTWQIVEFKFAAANGLRAAEKKTDDPD
jgi:hypothetical protein